MLVTNQSDLKKCVAQHGTVQRRHREAAMRSLPRIWPNPPGSSSMITLKSLSTLQVFDELGYLAIPPCLWGSQEVCHQSE